MASAKDTATFFSKGTSTQFEQVLALYPQALRMKAEVKAKKAEELIKLDNWYQNELPKKIKSRGKDAHMIHEELVQCMKWKQSRGKFFPQLSYLVKVNTPRMVVQETKKAFRKLPNNLEQAVTALSNLKGVGTTMASALLAAAAPELAAFMADECLMAIPEIEGIDYTIKEYLKFVQHIRNTVDRLNKSTTSTPNAVTWTPHKVELAVWTHFVVTEMKPELLTGEAPSSVANGTASGKTSPILGGLLGSTNGNGENSLDAASSSSSSGSGCGLMLSDDGCSNQGVDGLVGNHLEKNGKGTTTPGSTASTTPHLLSPPVPDEDTNTTNTSYTEDSMDTMPAVPPLMSTEGDETNDSILSDSTSTTNENSGSTGGTVGEGRKIGSVGIGLKRSRPDDINADSSVNLYDETANDAAPLPLTSCKRPRPTDDVQTSPVSLALPKATDQTPVAVAETN